jgi:hypothetical protein
MFPVMMVIGSWPEEFDPEISWPIECLSKDLSSFGPASTTLKNPGFGAEAVTL